MLACCRVLWYSRPPKQAHRLFYAGGGCTIPPKSTSTRSLSVCLLEFALGPLYSIYLDRFLRLGRAHHLFLFLCFFHPPSTLAATDTLFSLPSPKGQPCLSYSPSSFCVIAAPRPPKTISRPGSCSFSVRHLADHRPQNGILLRNERTTNAQRTALCRICEPIAFMSIFPYAYRMIETFNITSNADQISIYAGMLITAFAFAEFSTGMIWGRVSDCIGRKPVLIMGLVGTALSMLCFGFATSLPAAILARALGGLLNGNVGVLQTTVAELVTKKEHQPRAYSIMPFVWGLGSIVGPAMGGALAQPCESYPRLFPRGGLFDNYPFLLPNLVCVIILIFGIINGILFLEETHVQKRGKKDWGRRLGELLLNKLFHSGSTDSSTSYDFINEPDTLTEDDPPPGYRSTEGSPRLESTTTVVLQPDLEILREKETHGVVKTFNRHIVLIIVGYAILA